MAADRLGGSCGTATPHAQGQLLIIPKGGNVHSTGQFVAVEAADLVGGKHVGIVVVVMVVVVGDAQEEGGLDGVSDIAQPSVETQKVAAGGSTGRGKDLVGAICSGDTCPRRPDTTVVGIVVGFFLLLVRVLLAGIFLLPLVSHRLFGRAKRVHHFAPAEAANPHQPTSYPLRNPRFPLVGAIHYLLDTRQQVAAGPAPVDAAGNTAAAPVSRAPPTGDPVQRQPVFAVRDARQDPHTDPPPSVPHRDQPLYAPTAEIAGVYPHGGHQLYHHTCVFHLFFFFFLGSSSSSSSNSTGARAGARVRVRSRLGFGGGRGEFCAAHRADVQKQHIHVVGEQKEDAQRGRGAAVEEGERGVSGPAFAGEGGDVGGG